MLLIHANVQNFVFFIISGCHGERSNDFTALHFTIFGNSKDTYTLLFIQVVKDWQKGVIIGCSVVYQNKVNSLREQTRENEPSRTRETCYRAGGLLVPEEPPKRARISELDQQSWSTLNHHYFAEPNKNPWVRRGFRNSWYTIWCIGTKKKSSQRIYLYVRCSLKKGMIYHGYVSGRAAGGPRAEADGGRKEKHHHEALHCRSHWRVKKRRGAKWNSE
jgi:hypothetical protein